MSYQENEVVEIFNSNVNHNKSFWYKLLKLF